MRDLAEFRPSIVQVGGRYRDDRLRTYLAYEDHWALLVRVGAEIAGFALIRKSRPDTYVLGEFFIHYSFRRAGVGSSAAGRIFEEFPSKWEIPFQIENLKGATFWRKTILDLGYQAIEVNSQELGHPVSSNEVWLTFTS